ncbi:hypothetical protein ACQ86D_34355 [Streptomyces galilaeus]
MTDPVQPNTPSPADADADAASEPPSAPEPTASFSENGKTRVLYRCSTEEDVAPQDDGIFTTATVHNGTSRPVNYDIDVRVGANAGAGAGAGADWVA